MVWSVEFIGYRLLVAASQLSAVYLVGVSRTDLVVGGHAPVFLSGLLACYNTRLMPPERLSVGDSAPRWQRVVGCQKSQVCILVLPMDPRRHSLRYLLGLSIALGCWESYGINIVDIASYAPSITNHSRQVANHAQPRLYLRCGANAAQQR